MKLVQKIVKPYLSGLHLGSYTYLFSNILDNTLYNLNTKLFPAKTNTLFKLIFDLLISLNLKL